MFCKKTTLTNNSSKISTISYRRCSDNMIIPNHLVNPGETINIWYIDGTLKTAEEQQTFTDSYSFPPLTASRTALPTSTPRSTPSNTPTNTTTPPNTPSNTVTATPTKSLGSTPNPTNSPTSTRNSNVTPQVTTTPTLTPTITPTSGVTKYNVFRPQYPAQGYTQSGLLCTAVRNFVGSDGNPVGYTTKPLSQLVAGDRIFDLTTNQPISFFGNRWQGFMDVQLQEPSTPIYATFFSAGSSSFISQIQNCSNVQPTPFATPTPTITSNFTYNIFQDCCSTVSGGSYTAKYVYVLKTSNSDIDNGYGFQDPSTGVLYTFINKIVGPPSPSGQYSAATLVNYTGGYINQEPNYCQGNLNLTFSNCPNQPTPQPTSTPTVTNSVSPTNTPSPTTSRSFGATPPVTPDITPTPTISPSVSPTVTPTVTVSPTRAESPDSFIIEVEANASLRTFYLPLVNTGSYNFTVSWGDGQSGNVQAVNSINAQHTYAADGTYTIVINGTLNLWSFSFVPTSRLMLKKIKQWGNVNLFQNGGATITGQFNNCFNLISVDCPDLPILGTVLNNFFNGCRSLTTINRLNEWDMGKVTSTTNMFKDCFVFNGDVSGWSMNSCESLSGMFQNCYQFNSNLSNWNLKPNSTRFSVIINSFLTNAQSFNSPIFSGITLTLGNQSSIFSGCTIFNQPIVGWEFEKKASLGLNLGNMFNGCTAFNQDIGYFDFSEIETMTMTSMFRNATLFNQDLSDWCVSSIATQPAFFNTGANSTWVNTPSKQPRWGQLCYNVVTIGKVSAQVNSIVEVPVIFTVKEPIDMTVVGMKITYDPTKLSCANPRITYTWSGFTSPQDNCTGFTQNCGSGQAIAMVWSSANSFRFEGGELFKLRFNTLQAGLSPLNVFCGYNALEYGLEIGVDAPPPVGLVTLNVGFYNGSVNIT